jgi:hypothetical protein
MPYIGNTPALDYISFAVQNFTVTAGTTVYTLDYSVSNENDIALYINSVAQRPGASFAYSATGTTLTLTSATLVTDTMYAVFIGRAVQTVTPAAGSVTNTMLSPSVITGQTAVTVPATDDVLLCYDTSATALRKITFANFGNAPAFLARNNGSTSQAISTGTWTEITVFNTEEVDTNSAYNTTTSRFTPQVAGKYIFFANVYYTTLPSGGLFLGISKNGNITGNANTDYLFASANIYGPLGACILDLNGTTDYVSVFTLHSFGSSRNIGGGTYNSFYGYRLIGV